MRAGRRVVAVIAGAAVWAALWIGGSMVAAAVWPGHIAADRSVSDAGALLSYIAYSVVLSVGAGYITAWLAGADRAPRAVLSLAVLQLLLGLGIEISSWSLAPVWYHIVFLALLVPATVFGGRLRTMRAVTAPMRYAS